MSKRREIEANLAVLANMLVAATVLYTIIRIFQTEPLKVEPLNARKPAR
jgi:hypothetical protein